MGVSGAAANFTAAQPTIAPSIKPWESTLGVAGLDSPAFQAEAWWLVAVSAKVPSM